MSDMKLLDLSKPTALLAIGLMLVILVMVLPVPAWPYICGAYTLNPLCTI